MRTQFQRLDKIKISIVSYLNTTPLVYGLENYGPIQGQIDLQKDIPSECARKLIAGEVDLGLIPVAAIPSLKEANIVSDYCIGAVGKVKSVLLLSDVPLNKIEKIYLDYHSRTSINLCKVLCRELWNIEPEFIASEAGFENKVSGTTAGVIIGDRTFNLQKDYAFQFDLAEQWQVHTGLPFVFATWVSTKKLSADFIELFNKALEFGLDQLDLSIAHSTQTTINKEGLKDYLTEYIDFDFDSKKREAMNLFLSKLG